LCFFSSAHLCAQSLAKLLQPAFAWAAKRYQARREAVGSAPTPALTGSAQAAVGAELRKYGLRYDDLLDPTNNLDVAEAMERVPQEARKRRGGAPTLLTCAPGAGPAQPAAEARDGPEHEARVRGAGGRAAGLR
jgi:hypothetical protein